MGFFLPASCSWPRYGRATNSFGATQNTSTPHVAELVITKEFDTMKVCTKCGHENVDDVKLCTVCCCSTWTTVRGGETFGHENLKHPLEDYCLADAVRLANAEQSICLKPNVTSLIQAREVVKAMFKSMSHTWITGCCALDVLDAAIDGRDLKTDNRIC